MGRKRRDRDQPIVRGPAVQGRAPQERRETTGAGKGSARTVEGPGRVPPEDASATPPDAVGTEVPPGPEDVEGRERKRGR